MINNLINRNPSLSEDSYPVQERKKTQNSPRRRERRKYYPQQVVGKVFKNIAQSKKSTAVSVENDVKFLRNKSSDKKSSRNKNSQSIYSQLEKYPTEAVEKNKASGDEDKRLKLSSKDVKTSLEPKKVPSEKEEITNLLNEWVEKSQPGEQRSVAYKRIMDCLFSSSTEKKLDIAGLELSDLPDIFGYQISQKIRNLDLSNNQLVTLPESIGDLTKLLGLYLSSNQLVTLPGSIGNLTKLLILDLSSNQLVTLPESIGNLTKLLDLYLSSNQLVTLPESIGNLTQLSTLYLRWNRTLIGLPGTVLNLSEACTVELSNTGLSESSLQHLGEASAAEGYQGPRFSYSMREHKLVDNKPLEEVLKEMYTLLKKEVPAFPDLEKRLNRDALSLWLNKISYIGDYNAKGDIQTALVEKTLSFVEKAYENAEFAEVFKGVIYEASTTCGDRMALSIVHLGVAHHLSQMDTSNLPMLGEFLVNTVWVIEILEECAQNKIPSLRFFDEVEVYLGYIVKLKDILSLSVAIEDMLYFACSALSEEDLAVAANTVEEKLASSEKYSYLVKNEKWIDALKEQFPSEMKQIDKARYTDYENNPETWEVNYNTALIELSKQVYA